MIKTHYMHSRSIFFCAVAICVAGLLLFASTARAQLTINVETSSGRQVPIAIAPFAQEANAPQNITPLIADNLVRSGMFRIVNTVGISNLPTEPSQVNFIDWSGRSTEALVIGGIKPLPDGRFEVNFRLFDVAKQNQLVLLWQ